MSGGEIERAGLLYGRKHVTEGGMPRSSVARGGDTGRERAGGGEMARAGRMTSGEWAVYFECNLAAVMGEDVPWELGVALSEEERGAIGRSVQEFQLGESGEGRGLMARARRWAEANDDPDYVRALGMFIAEENRHARELGMFMDLAGIKRVRRTVGDGVFRKLRRLAGLELCVVVLVTAEVIAKVYYAALAGATGSGVLRAICARILRDEAAHVRFQCERLGMLRAGKGRWGVWWREWGQGVLVVGTCGVMWPKHGAVMKRAGMGFGGFLGAVWGEFGGAREVMRGNTGGNEG